MSIRIELDAHSIKEAISAHISAQGFNLEGKTVEVALVNGRGGNGNRATIIISDNDTSTPSKVVKKPSPLKKPSPKTATEVVALDEVEGETIMDVNVEDDSTDAIMKAAESTDIDVVDLVENDKTLDLFPATNPAEVQTSASLF